MHPAAIFIPPFSQTENPAGVRRGFFCIQRYSNGPGEAADAVAIYTGLLLSRQKSAPDEGVAGGGQFYGMNWISSAIGSPLWLG
jgi:hypothetical protein